MVSSQINHRILFKTVQKRVEFHIGLTELPAWFTDYLPSIVQMFLQHPRQVKHHA